MGKISKELGCAPLKKKLQVAGIICFVIVCVLIGMLGKFFYENSIQEKNLAAWQQEYESLSAFRRYVEEVFSVPFLAFELLEDDGHLVKLRDISLHNEQENIVEIFDILRTKFPIVRAVSLITRDGEIVTSGDIYHERDSLIEAADRALILREGEFALSRFQTMTRRDGTKEDVLLYSTPLECIECKGVPQISALVFAMSREAFFPSIHTGTFPDTFFVVDAEGSYVYAPAQKNMSVFQKDFADDYARIIEYRNTRFLTSKDNATTFFVTTLYPGLDGRINGVPRKLNARYIPTPQQYWVMVNRKEN